MPAPNPLEQQTATPQELGIDPEIYSKMANSAITDNPQEIAEPPAEGGLPNHIEFKKNLIESANFEHEFAERDAEKSGGANRLDDEWEAEQVAYAIKPDMDKAVALKQQIKETGVKNPQVPLDGDRLLAGTPEALELQRQAAIADASANAETAIQRPETIPTLQETKRWQTFRLMLLF